MDDERLTEALQAEQDKRATREEALSRTSDDEGEIAQHERRADKARYLREKLEEREASERDG